MNKTVRKALLPAALAATTLVIGCQMPFHPTAGKPRVVVHVGNLKFEQDASLALVLKFERGQFNAQALASYGIHRVQVTVSSSKLAQPLIAEVTQEQFEAGQAVFNFSDIPPGIVNIRVNAYDANGQLIQWADGTAEVVPNQTTTYTLYCNTATGSLKIIYDCPDCPSPAPSPTPTPTPIPSPGFATSSVLVEGRYGHTSQTIGNYVYLVGGMNSSGHLSSLERAEILPNGSLTGFSQTNLPQLTRPRGDTSSVVIGDYLYVLGVYGSANDRSVERAQFDANGNLGSFTLLPGVTLKGSSSSHSTVRIGNYVYVIGGYIYAGQNKNTVDRASIDENNNLSDFYTLSGVNLPEARTYSTVQIIGNYLYVIGGSSTGSNTLSAVARAEIDPVTSNISTFSAVSGLSTARLGATSFIKDGYLYVVGGQNASGLGISSVERAEILDYAGNIGNFEQFTGASLQTARGQHSSVLIGNFLHVAGGYNSTSSPTSLNSTEISAF